MESKDEIKDQSNYWEHHDTEIRTAVQRLASKKAMENVATIAMIQKSLHSLVQRMPPPEVESDTVTMQMKALQWHFLSDILEMLTIFPQGFPFNKFPSKPTATLKDIRRWFQRESVHDHAQIFLTGCYMLQLYDAVFVKHMFRTPHCELTRIVHCLLYNRDSLTKEELQQYVDFGLEHPLLQLVLAADIPRSETLKVSRLHGIRDVTEALVAWCLTRGMRAPQAPKYYAEFCDSRTTSIYSRWEKRVTFVLDFDMVEEDHPPRDSAHGEECIEDTP